MSRLWDLSITDRIAGYEPADVVSITAGPAICLYSTVWSVHHVANVATRVQISLEAPLKRNLFMSKKTNDIPVHKWTDVIANIAIDRFLDAIEENRRLVDTGLYSR